MKTLGGERAGLKILEQGKRKIAYQRYHQGWVIGKQGIIQTRNYVWP